MIKNTEFNTCPLVFHAPGHFIHNPAWELITQIKQSPHVDCDQLDIITWNSSEPTERLIHNGKTLGIFEKSIPHLKHTVLGKNSVNWTNREKINLTVNHLQQSTFKYTLGADSGDAIMIGEPTEILNRFLKMDCDLLFNADMNCWPFDPEIRDFEEQVATSTFKYLNAGVWIGETTFCLDFFKETQKIINDTSILPEWSEQALLKKTYKKLYPKVKLDHNCEIFQVLNGLPPDMIVKRTIKLM